MEQARGSTLNHHVSRLARLGTSVLIRESLGITQVKLPPANPERIRTSFYDIVRLEILPLGRSVAGFVPDRVTTDGHNSYPRAIRSTRARNIRHRIGTRPAWDQRTDPMYARPPRPIVRPNTSAASTTHSATSFAVDPITISTFQGPTAARFLRHVRIAMRIIQAA